jgi:hypothetical protein
LQAPSELYEWQTYRIILPETEMYSAPVVRMYSVHGQREPRKIPDKLVLAGYKEVLYKEQDGRKSDNRR